MTTGNSEFAFSPETYVNRRAQTVELMKQRGIDVLAISTVLNYNYLSGIGFGVEYGLFCLVLTQDGQGRWVTRHTEVSNVAPFIERAGWSEIARSITDDQQGQAYEVLGDVLHSILKPGQVLGLELGDRMFTPAGVQTLTQRVSSNEVVNATGLIESLRAKKSPEEIGYMKAAGEITAAGIRSGLSLLHEGMTENAFAGEIFKGLLLAGSEELPLMPMVVTGPRSARAHVNWANAPIRRGDLITIETTGVVNSYTAPAYRIAMVGQPSAEAKELWEASAAGAIAGLHGIGPGMTGHEADLVVREAIKAAGFLDKFPVRAAYPVGASFRPTWVEENLMAIRPGEEGVLQVGMTFHMVPALYAPGLGAACCSVSFYVSETGIEALVPLPLELLTVD